MYWSPNFLAVVFRKQEISQQVVTRMQDLASEFSKIFRTLTAGEGDLLPTQHAARPLARRGVHAPRCWDPYLGPPPQLFSRGCAPGGNYLGDTRCRLVRCSQRSWRQLFLTVKRGWSFGVFVYAQSLFCDIDLMTLSDSTHPPTPRQHRILHPTYYLFASVLFQ